MEIDLQETVECTEAPSKVWPSLLSPFAVTNMLGVADDVRPLSVDAPDDGLGAVRGHTFKIVGLGGGLYHARIDAIEEPHRVVYAVWRDDTPDQPALFELSLETVEGVTELTGSLSVDLPVEMIFAGFSGLLMPFLEPIARKYTEHRLREHLTKLATSD